MLDDLSRSLEKTVLCNVDESDGMDLLAGDNFDTKAFEIEGKERRDSAILDLLDDDEYDEGKESYTQFLEKDEPIQNTCKIMHLSRPLMMDMQGLLSVISEENSAMTSITSSMHQQSPSTVFHSAFNSCQKLSKHRNNISAMSTVAEDKYKF